MCHQFIMAAYSDFLFASVCRQQVFSILIIDKLAGSEFILFQHGLQLSRQLRQSRS